MNGIASVFLCSLGSFLQFFPNELTVVLVFAVMYEPKIGETTSARVLATSVPTRIHSLAPTKS